MPENKKESQTEGRNPREEGRDEQSGQHANKGSSSEDLKKREYRDNAGEVHHHTKKYMEQHQGGSSTKGGGEGNSGEKGGGGSSSRGRGGSSGPEK